MGRYGLLVPFEHYIPLHPDLNDLEEKVQWAINHPEEAAKIAQAGMYCIPFSSCAMYYDVLV
jgi:spore maturation protein CgeB